MIMFIVSVLIGTCLIILMGFIVRYIFEQVRDLIRIILYYIGIDTFTREEKVYIGWIEETKAPPVNLKADIVTNCILSKENFPNIAEYFQDYKEYEVIRQETPCKEVVVEPKGEFDNMTYKQHLRKIEMLKLKRQEGKLSLHEEVVLKFLSDPINIERSKQHDLSLKRIRDY